MMNFKITYSGQARIRLLELQNPSLSKRYKAVIKTLLFMAANIRHPGLNTHEFGMLSKEFGCKVFESYAENNTPGAYRIFWRYGPAVGEIEIIDIIPHQ